MSPEAVAISYAAFWDEKQYWRAITASFSHFEPLHLILNMMSLWNLGPLEELMGTFRYLYLVRVSSCSPSGGADACVLAVHKRSRRKRRAEVASAFLFACAGEGFSEAVAEHFQPVPPRTAETALKEQFGTLTNRS